MRFEGIRRGYNEMVRRGEAVALPWPQMAGGATGGARGAEGEQCRVRQGVRDEAEVT
jgi:hypothetical protein